MPRAFTEQEREVIRAQFREKGRRLFEKHGLRKTSVDELTAAVGVSKGAFYLFYAFKEELFLEILEDLERTIQSRILEFVVQPGAGSRQNLKNLLVNFLVTWDDYPILKNFNKNDFEYLIRKIPPERALKHAHNDAKFAGELIQKIKRAGLTINVSPRVMGNLLKSLFFIGLHREDMEPGAYEETMEILTDLTAGYIAGE